MNHNWEFLLKYRRGNVRLRAGGLSYAQYEYGTSIRAWSTVAPVSGLVIVKQTDDPWYAVASKSSATGIFWDVLREYYFHECGSDNTIHFTAEMFDGMINHVVDIIQHHVDLGVLMSRRP